MKQPLQDFFIVYSAAMRRSSNATQAYIADFGGLLQIVGGPLFLVRMYHKMNV